MEGSAVRMSEASFTDIRLEGLAETYFQLLMAGERLRASERILRAVHDDGMSVRDVYLNVFQPVLYEVGRLWQANVISVATEHYCTAATQLIMSQLFPNIASAPKIGKSMVGCCVGGELHELGMRMVCDFFEMEGWHTYYLGANSPNQAVVEALEQREAVLLGISVSLTSNVHLVRRLVRCVRDSQVGASVQVMVGGLPFLLNPGLVEQVGADASARNAEEAVAAAYRLLESPK